MNSPADSALPVRHPAFNTPLAVMLLVLGIYLLTMSGHTYSPDEETMLAASQSLVEQGTWAMAPSRSLVQVTGVDGRRYSQYGPGQSFGAVPWVEAGRLLGGLFPKDKAGYALRFVLATYNALITAGIAGILAAAGLALGYRRRASVAVALGLAFCTFLWPHSRTFFAEPLVALCLLASFYLLIISPLRAFIGKRVSWLLPFFSGVLFAFAVAAKVQYVIALPTFLVYLAWLAFRASRPGRWAEGSSYLGARASMLQAVSWLAGLAIGMVPLLVYNLLIFGNLFTTGYGSDLKATFKTPLGEGAYGLLLSPGKGLLWYALPLLLAVWGLPRFARKYRAETVFVLLLGISVMVFFALYRFWPGDGAWGPRYMAPIVPFLLIPAFAALDSALAAKSSLARVAVAVPLALGFFVNLPGTLVNFDTYINIASDEPTRYYTVESSPIAGHLNVLDQRMHEAALVTVPQPGTVLFKSGFSYPEGDKVRGELLPRWTTGNGEMEIDSASLGGPSSVTLRISDHRPPELPRAQVTILVNGSPVQVQGVPVPNQPVSTDYTIPLPAGRSTLTIRSDTWNPSKLQSGARNEDLGVMLGSIAASDGGTYQMAEAQPAPPYYPQPRWYYDPGTHHPADLWFVYMLESGIGRRAWLVLGLPLIVLALACLVVGMRGLSRA